MKLTNIISEYFLGTESRKQWGSLERFYREFDKGKLFNRDIKNLGLYRKVDFYVGKMLPNGVSLACLYNAASEARFPYEAIASECLRIGFMCASSIRRDTIKMDQYALQQGNNSYDRLARAYEIENKSKKTALKKAA